MNRLKRGIAILLCASMAGSMMPLPASAEGTTYGSILQTENAGQSVKGEENTGNPENQGKENAGDPENQNEENAGGTGNQDEENAGGSGNQDEGNAGGTGNQDEENAGDSGNQGKENAGDSGNQDEENAGDSGNQGKENAGDSGNENEENAGDSENQDEENAGISEDEQEENSSETSRTIIVTGFEELEEAVMYQQLAIGTEEKDIAFPDELTVTVRIRTESELTDGEADTDNADTDDDSRNAADAEDADITEDAETSSELYGITWKLEEEESDGAVFDSSKACNGYCYVYTPELPEMDADGNSIQVAEDAELPMIYVLIGRQQVMALSADHYDENGFCSGYELKSDGTWAKKEGDDSCTEEGCCGYQPAVLTSGTYDIDGNGTMDEVYEIGNAGQLYWFAGLVNGDTGVCTGEVTRNLSANAVLTADITVNENVLKEDGTLSDGTSSFRSWTPIGSLSNDDSSYSGRFDGQSHTISGLYFNDPTEWKGAGLFGEAGSDAVISNVGIVDSYFQGCDGVGGVCGCNFGTIRGSYNTGTVIVTMDKTGGVCGVNYGGVIANCYNAGNISGSENSAAGGVCGDNDCGTITNCYNTGIVSEGTVVGGVCGRLDFNEETNSGAILSSYNTGKITATGSYGGVGGVCGYALSGTILNSYNIGSVTVTGPGCNAGGVCGYNAGVIANSHSTGKVTAAGSDSSVGGVCGSHFEPGTIANSYFDSANYSGKAVGGGVVDAAAEGRTTDQFASGEVAWLLSQGCTIGEGGSAVTYDGSAWGQKLGEEAADTYPVLDSAKKVYKGYNGSCIAIYSNSQLSQTPVHSFGTDGFCTVCGAYEPAVLTSGTYDIDGNGTMDEVYEIGNAGQLYWFAGLVNGEESVCTDGVTQNTNANAVLTADITVNKNVLNADGTPSDSTDGFRSWTPIGNSTAYSGCFDGQSHTISGLYFSNPDADNVGLFCTAGASAVISNVGIRDSYFYGGNSVGAMCGKNSGTVTDCYNAGYVKGRGQHASGVCGWNKGGTIRNSYNTGTVTAGYGAGGVCGKNQGGTIRNCYNTGKVTASGGWAGGVCELNSGTVSGSIPTITGSYNTGEVTVTGSDGKAGGVCGENDGAITNSYNTGVVTAAGSGCKAGGVCGYNENGTLSNSYSAGKITVAASDGVAGGVCGTSKKTISNCYFDSTIYSGDAVGSGSGEATATEGKTAAQFASGEVAYLLNEGKTDSSQAWYQNIDNEGTKDSLPVLDSTHGTVYIGDPCPYKYSNSDAEVPHSFALDPQDETQHKCTECGHTEKHADVAAFTADPEAHSITASCSCENLGTVTLSAAGAVYDGTDKAASASGTIRGITVPAIVYERKNGEAYTEIADTPKEAGTYRAGITLGTGANAATVTVEYTIQPAAPVITWNTPTSVCYTGKAVTLEKLATPDVTLVNGETFDGAIVYSYREHGSDAAFTEGLPTERGTYDVKAGIAADGNYTQAETTITLTITWLETDQKAALTDQDNKSLSGAAWWASGVTFTAPDGFTISDSLTGIYGASFTYDTETTAAGTTLTYYLKNSDGEIAEKSEAVRIDKTAPDWAGDNCGISIKENWWKSLLNSISFGLLYKENVDVKVSAADSLSGVAAYYYYVDSAGSTVKTAEELDKLGFTAYTKVQGQNPVTVTSLALDGSYLVYAYAVDAAGNRSAYVCSNGVVVDLTAPVISDVSTPAKNDSTLTDTGAKISFTGSEAGTYFYVLAENNSSAPTSITAFATEQTHDGYSVWTAEEEVSYAPMKAGAGNEITLSGLKADTAYTLYLAAVDPAGNSTGTTVESREFTTCKTMPQIAAMPAVSGIYGQTVSGMTLTDGKAEVQNTEITGTWRVTDAKASDMPAVGTTDSYTVTFEPTETQYETVSVQVTPVVAQKPVTVTAEDKTKTYGQNNPAFTFTVPDGTLAGSDTEADLAVVLSCPATADSPVKEGGYAITGTSSSANYEVTIVPGTLTITRADAEITVSTAEYVKTFGEAAFALEVTDSNTEADVQYAVTAGSDVISVEDGTVTILKAGDAEITVSLPASTNYNAAASVTITVKVAKKGGYAAADITRSYLHISDKEDAIDLSKYLPADCGAAAYGTPQVTGALYTDGGQPEVSGDGTLSYTIKQADSAGAEGTIKVTVTTDNYEDFIITVKVKLVDRYPVSLRNGTSVTLKSSTLTYGETLSKLAFNSAVFVDENGKAVAGTLAWKTPAATPDAGTTNAAWVFTPKDASYATVEDTVAITVKKAVPHVTAAPTVAERVYHPDKALVDADLTGGSVTGVDGQPLSGKWSFAGINVVPTVSNTGYQAVFTPLDTMNYETVTRTVTVSVTKATPYITGKPAASAITYGQTLADSSLTGGSAACQAADGSAVTGSFAWKNGTTRPAVADSDRTEYEVTFIPSDTVNYNTAATTLTLTVRKAPKAPGMPDSVMRPSHSTATVGDIMLPEGWSWQESDKDITLSDDIPVTAAAVYTGADQGNYETESVSITITRSKCDHKNTETRDYQKATCIAEGYTGDIYCKDCGEKLTSGKVTEKGPHTVGTPASCVSKAVCSVCKEEYGDVDVTSHVHTNVRNRREATCTQAGYTGDTYCTDCNRQLAAGKEIMASGHDYQAAVTKQPTTTEEGIRTYTCSKCGSSYTESIGRLQEKTHSHSYTGSVTRTATCTDTGVRNYTCSCGDSYTETIPMTGHSYTSTVTKQPTTTEEGVMTYTCGGCGHSFTQPVARITGAGNPKPGTEGNTGTAENGNTNSETEDTGSNAGKNGSSTEQGSGSRQDSPDQKETDTGSKPYIRDENGKEGWDVIRTQLAQAKAGETVTVVMNGTTVVPKNVIDSIKGGDITLVLDMGNGISWKINGKDITEASGDIDFGITVGTGAGKSIPVDVINNVTGERYSMNLTLAYSGEFGFTATLTINMDSRNAGLYANLFYYNEQTGEMEFVSAGKIDAEGNAELMFTHASDYTIVIDQTVMNGDGEQQAGTPATAPILVILGICILFIVSGAVFYVRRRKKPEEE